MSLTGQQEEAAALVAADLHTDKTICEAVGVKNRVTLHRWKQLPAFKAAVEAHRAAYAQRVRATGLAIVENRVAALNDRWKRMQAVIDARAEDEAMQTVAGGSTGLLAHSLKAVGRGDDFQLIDVYEVDTGLLKELREHERQAAQELGQWLDKTETRHVGNVVITSIKAIQPPVRPAEDAAE